jgi:hypothetical protein
MTSNTGKTGYTTTPMTPVSGCRNVMASVIPLIPVHARVSAFSYGTLIAVGIILLAVVLMFLLPLFNPFKLSIGTDNVTIQSPIYATGFPISGIREVKLIDTLPGGTRTNGISTGQYNLGNFTLNGYGKSKMYVYDADSPFLVISLDNLTVFYNSKNPEQTQLIYSQLLQYLK